MNIAVLALLSLDSIGLPPDHQGGRIRKRTPVFMCGAIARSVVTLHSVVIEKIGKIEGIQNTETFVELQKTDKDPIYLIQ